MGLLKGARCADHGNEAGHDGALAVVEDRRLVMSLESEKDSWQRHRDLTPMTFLQVAEHVGRCPDIVALGGWRLAGGSGQKSVGAGYHGVAEPVRRAAPFFGHEATLVSSSHVRSHIMAAVGLAPREEHPQQAAWCGRASPAASICWTKSSAWCAAFRC